MKGFRSLLLLVFVSCIFGVPTSYGQSTYDDFSREKDIHQKAVLAMELWNRYMLSDVDSMKIISVELLIDATEFESEFARVVGRRILGSYLWKTGKLDQGLENMMQCLDYFEKNEDWEQASVIYNEAGHVLYLKGEFDEAIQAYKRSMIYGKKSTDPTDAFNGEIGIGKCYISKGDTAIGMQRIQAYKQKCLGASKFSSAADAYAFLGQVEGERGNIDLSNEYYAKSLQYSKLSGSKIHLSHSYANMGILKFGLGEMDSSLYYFNQSLDLRVQLNNLKGIVEGHYNLGYYYMANEDYEQSLEFFEKSKKLAHINDLLMDEIDALSEMMGIYKTLGDSVQVQLLRKEKETLESLKTKQEGIDEDVLKSIQSGIKINEDEKKAEIEDDGTWVYIVVVIVAAGLIALWFAERRKN